jgi:hypothetical protein
MYGRYERCMRGFGKETRGKKTTSKTNHECKDNIKMDLQGLGWRVTDGINLSQDRKKWLTLINAVINLQFR